MEIPFCNKIRSAGHYLYEGAGSGGNDSVNRRARRRDTAAFGELYGQVYTDLYRYALYRLGTREEAEDAVQETALEAFKGIGRLQKPDAFRSWIFTILNARCNRHIRGLVRSREETPLEECSLSMEDFSPELLTACRLREAIAALSDEDRQLVLLSVVGGFSGSEIAAMMKRPPGTLRCRLHRTLKKLRETLDEETD